jgi:hypothetical protein
VAKKKAVKTRKQMPFGVDERTEKVFQKLEARYPLDRSAIIRLALEELLKKADE